VADSNFLELSFRPTTIVDSLALEFVFSVSVVEETWAATAGFLFFSCDLSSGCNFLKSSIRFLGRRERSSSLISDSSSDWLKWADDMLLEES